MKKVVRFSLPFLLVAGLITLALILGTRFTAAEPGAPDVAPAVMNYQGYLTDDAGDPIEGQADFLFGIFAASSGGSALWDEDHNNVTVSSGYFNVLLGSTDPLSAVDFSSDTRYLEVIVNTGSGDVTLPRQRLGSVPYALQAQVASTAPWSGLTGVPDGFADNIDDIEFENVITVVKSGGQFSIIQEAIDTISDASADNRYLVWVGPGIYNEQVIMKDYVYLVGASQWLTTITSDIDNPDIYPPDQATLKLASFSEVRDLTVINEGVGFRNVAILGDDGSSLVKLTQVTARSQGGGEINYGIFLHGQDTRTELYDAHSLAINGLQVNVGFENVFSATVVIEGGDFTAIGGDVSVGLVNGAGGYLQASGITAEAHDTGNGAYGLIVGSGGDTSAELDGGRFIATNGQNETTGILVDGVYLRANNVFALGGESPAVNQGLQNNGGTVELNGGSFRGQGGVETFGLINLGGGWLAATGVTATGEGSTVRNDGLRNESGASVLVTGSLLIGRSGEDSRGAANYGADSVLNLNQVTAHGEGGPEETFRVGTSNEEGGLAFVTNSELWGDSISFLVEGATSSIHLSTLKGGPVSGSGDKICLGVTWGASFFADSCPVVIP